MSGNIFSILNILGGEAGRQTALILARTFSEKLKKRTVYIPAGITFDDTGIESLTELYFDFLKEKEFRFDKTENLIIIKPFNCFAEFMEIDDNTYLRFISSISELFDISVVNMENLPSRMLLHFMENSMTTAAVIDCGQNDYASGTENFMKNLKLLWGNFLPDHLDRFIFIINKGNESEKLLVNDILLRESTCENYDFINKIYFMENNFLSRKTLFNNKQNKKVFNGFNMPKNISRKKERLPNAK